MQRRHLLLTCLLITIALLVACDMSPGGGGNADPDPRVKPSTVKTWPAVYQGEGKASQQNTVGQECTMDAQLTFTANQDHTCELQVEHPYTNIVGDEAGDFKCVPDGTRLRWTLTGTFDQQKQECVFSGCNKVAAFSATGSLAFTAESTVRGGNLSCVWVKGNRTVATFGAPPLKLVK